MPEPFAPDNKPLENAPIDAGTREKFLSLFAHELKTPLTPLGIQSHVIRRILQKYTAPAGAPAPTAGTVSVQLEDLQSIEKMLTISDQQIRRLSEFVGKLLELSRLEAPVAPPLQLRPTHLGELTREVADRLRPLLEDARCEFRLEVLSDLPGNWDRFRLDQVITNLVINALTFAAGKPIDAQVSAAEDGRSMRLRVQDHGNGLSPEDVPQLFTRFFRGKNALKSRGLGLGLYLSREIAGLHGGTLQVENLPEKGVTFTLELPV